MHGTPDNPNGGSGNKDGWTNNIRVDYANVTAVNGVAEIWLVQDTPRVFYRAPDLRQTSSTDARALLARRQAAAMAEGERRQRVQFPLPLGARQNQPPRSDAAVSGADGRSTSRCSTGSVPAELATRFKYIAPGVALQAKGATPSGWRGC